MSAPLRVVLATGNPGKVREVAAILEDPAIELAGPEALVGVVFPAEGDAYEANARAKARTAARASGCVALADDSGLEVEALGGRPGPHSARYGGADLDDRGRCERMLRELEGVPESARAARFVCVAAVAMPDGREEARWGTCSGRILGAARGDSGFGYDPIFAPEGHVRAMAELAPEEKNRLSHRAAAFRALLPVLRGLG